MISGYLLLPVKLDLPVFLKTRFTRVLFPFIFWCIAYSFYFLARGKISVTDAFLNIPKILVNYGTEVGHLWYIYMLIGIYLFAPIISPWIEKAKFSHFIYYIVFWAITGCIKYIHLVFPNVWGECSWNNTPMLHYFTGHMGYALLGAFIKLHLNKYDLYWLGIILIIFGYAMTTCIYEYMYYIQTESAVDLEMSWDFHLINVMMETAGIFLVLRKIQCNNKYIVTLFQDIALKSYGMYLCHIMLLDGFQTAFDPNLNHPTIFIPLIALATFISTYIIVKAISYIPFSKYIIG
ncbi:transmembrane acyltransferase [Tritrichomonas foetus]|uniref:Transmembrane acyltransferase n=1 Tax=Tritrichomonas foetus TaxID=1144522 RepID=A0A1J4JNB5_9EUKA|nr:transmembrane acyltransferase [Tritrichomonas foetus]|eukprot:OHT00617.1 transmembrane acyltransferase [Tritrichomonas foetus]